MIDEERNETDPSTDDGDELDLGSDILPVADAAAETKVDDPVIDEPPPAAEPPAPALVAPVGPRSFPQHYTLLLGAVFVAIAGMTVWEREAVFGAEIEADEMISGTFLFAMAVYSIIVGVMNIMLGRLKGMMSAFITGAAALYFGIKKAVATFAQDRALFLGEIQSYVYEKKMPAQGFYAENPDAFPKSTLDRMEDAKEVYIYWIGQVAPGVWWSILGGLLMVWVFLKAFMPAKKAEPAPAPSRSRSGRRR
jgi:hypothetical protein